eukprot:g1112.t1
MNQDEALLTAARDGNFNDVRRLINNEDVDINTVDKTGNSALHLSVLNGHSNITTFLLEKGAEVNLRNALGETALLLAARSGDNQTVSILLRFGADKRIEDDHGRTPFFVAMSGQHPDVASQLLPGTSQSPQSTNLFGRSDATGNNNSNTTQSLEQNRINSALKKDEQHLRDAAEAGDIVSVKEIIKLSPEIDLNSTDDQGHTALYRASFYGRTQVVEFLLKQGANADLDDMDGQTSLHVAAERGFGRITQALLEKTKDVNVQNLVGSTPMLSAAQNGNISVLRELLKFGADPNTANNNEETPLWAATKAGHEDFVRVLLEFTTKNEIHLRMNGHAAVTGQTPLHVAAERGDERIARLLLDFGASKEVRDATGSTPLFIAADKGRTRTVSLLLDYGASVNSINDHGETPLYVSALNGHVPVTRELLKKEADTEAADNNGQTPLMGAAQEGHTAIISQLIQAEAEIEAANHVGETPVMVAALEGFQNAVALLVDNGADIETARNDGRTALHLSAMDGHIGALKVLLSASLDSTMWSRIAQGQRSSPLHLATDTQGETALHLATRFRQVSAMKMLLDYDNLFHEGLRNESTIYGKLADVQNKFGWTALHGAVDRAHRGAVDLLLENEANVNAADIFGNTPIHLASRGVDFTILYNLIKMKDSKTGSLNVDGRTPLHFAAACVRPSAATFLLNAGADVHSTDVYKKQPMDVLASRSVCNPEAAVSRGLCNISKQRPDMCPVTIGDKSELIETKVLLQVAENQRNKTKPCFGNCSGDEDFNSSNTVYSENTRQSMSRSNQDSISFSLLTAIIPVVVLVLLAMLLFYLYRKKKTVRRAESLPRRFSHIFYKQTQGQKSETENYNLNQIRLSSGSQFLTNANPKGPFDTVRRLLAQGASHAETSKFSDSGTDTDSCCGWSSESEDEEPKNTITLNQYKNRGLASNNLLTQEEFPTIKVALPHEGLNSSGTGTASSYIDISSWRSMNTGLPPYRLGSVPRAKPRDPPVQSKRSSFSIRISDDGTIGEPSDSFTCPDPNLAQERSASTPLF